MERSFSTFIGVDLGGGKGKTTAVARLASNPKGVLEVLEVGTARDNRDPWYDDTLVDYLREHAESGVVAIDAPLTLTACVRCREPACPGVSACVDPTIVWFRTTGDQLVAESMPNDRERVALASIRTSPKPPKPMTTPYTQRATEVVLHRRHGIQPRETLGQGMGPLTARAAHLVRAMRGHGYELHRNLIEVYPKATLHKLWGGQVAKNYKRHTETWEIRAKVLESLRGSLEFSQKSRLARESCLQNDHCFDALICAYTAFLWARDGWTLPKDDHEVYAVDGWIYAPGVGQSIRQAGS